MKFDIPKLQRMFASLELENLSGYELYALSGMIKSLAETTIYDEIADKTLTNQLFASTGTDTKN